MIALKAEDVRAFTSRLFLGEDFDRFLVREATIVTYNSFSIDGRVRRGFYTDEETEEENIEEYSSWKKLRPICFSLIKGKKLPLGFSIVLQLSRGDTERFAAGAEIGIDGSQIQGLYLNIRYEEGELYCVTGTSVSFFTLDKSLELEWDRNVREFLRDHEIPCKEQG